MSMFHDAEQWAKAGMPVHRSREGPSGPGHRPTASQIRELISGALEADGIKDLDRLAVQILHLFEPEA